MDSDWKGLLIFAFHHAVLVASPGPGKRREKRKGVKHMGAVEHASLQGLGIRPDLESSLETVLMQS